MQPIKKTNLVDEVYGQLLNMLASGEYSEGSKLPSETQLCEALRVSRNTVRTAMSKLIALGIVENQQGYGNVVRNMNIGMYTNSILPCMLAHARDLVAATEFRIGVESMAARLAAMRATDDDIKQLKQAFQKADQAVGTEYFAIYDMEFHRIIAEATRNPLFIRTSEMIETMYTTWLIGFQRNHGVEKSHDYHSQIYEAIKDHQPDVAALCMQQHLEDVLHNIIADNESKKKSSSLNSH